MVTQRCPKGICHFERRQSIIPWVTNIIEVGEVAEKCSEDRAAASTWADSEDLFKEVKWRWASKGREELAKQRSEEECILPGRENSMCKGPGVMLELGRLRKG